MGGLLLAVLAGCATHSPQTAEAAPRATACPVGVPALTRCLRGTDSAGAHYLIAVPDGWRGTLVLHAHGGPALGEPKYERTVEDLQRWTVVLRAGHAWAGSSFRQGGVAVRAAAEDTERLRNIFLQHVAKPKLTLLHGQSWGAGVAAVGASMFTGAPGARPYDGVLLTSGVLGGGSHSYDFRLDLRVVYQALCGNHPRPDEPQYPLAIGLPQDARLTSTQLRERADECLGLSKPAAKRTPEQRRKLETITQVLKIPESSVHGHLAWATFHFQEIAHARTGGRSPFGNAGVQYTGSADDAWLNRAVARYVADPSAAATFANDTDPDGRIPVPVLTLHGIGDPTAFVELESVFRETMERAGTAGHLVQAFTGHNTHSYLADPVYLAAFEALERWTQGGAKPTPQELAQRCEALQTARERCLLQPGYTPQPLSQRVAPRR
ncbi:hypothetical protein [Ramlibacter albus]|uniref:Alpha/beta hydrolase n=1 Tax=Ramlibacter albus TaxID=2079448 RepID=A0A923S5A4_9BURK|nr:hypothetical protein [Ramlibacter albus]MBC5764977.1 hypothetical protein [Ramlibacter albus]